MPSFFVERIKNRARASLWLVPGGAAALALVLAKGLPVLEAHVPHRTRAWYLFAGQASSARELVSTIASSMMTFTGLVFSVTILVLQLASQQFSPRVLRTFLEDGTTRLAMGSFIGSFVYAMALLPEIRNGGVDGDERVPAFSVFFALVLVLVSVGVFVRYIHRMAHSIRAVHVLRRVADDGARSIEHTFPKQAAKVVDEPPRRPAAPPDQIVRNGAHAGVLAAIDEEALVEIAKRNDALIEVIPYPGDFVVRGAPMFNVWGPSSVEPEHLLAHVALEVERTAHQDPAFAVRQLVDVAERALSPGVNDPTTAVQAIDRLHDLLTALADREFPPTEIVDDSGRARLLVRRPSWESLVHLAFDEVRHYGGGSIQVVRRLRAALQDLRDVAPVHRRRVLDEQLMLLDATATRFREPADREIARVPSHQGHGRA